MDRYFELFPNGIDIQPIYNGPVTVYGVKILDEDLAPIVDLKDHTFHSELALIEKIENYGYTLGEGFSPDTSARFDTIIAPYHISNHAIFNESGVCIGEVDVIRGGKGILQEFKTAIKNTNTRP